MRRQGDDRNMTERAIGFELARDLPSVHPGQRQINHNHIRTFYTRLLVGAFSVAGDDQAIAILEQLDEQVPIELDVLDDQDGLQSIRHRSVRAA